MKVITAPESIFPLNHTNIFLGGSIEMGKAIEWQKDVIEAFKDYDVTLFNPRRNDWNSNWEQSINNPQFVEQVEWELDALDFSDFIILYFQPNTLSPISLLELGLHAKYGNRVIVVCPKGFWRKGNIDIVCRKYNIILFETLEEAISHIKTQI